MNNLTYFDCARCLPTLLVIRSVSSFLCNVKVCQRLPEYGVHFHRVLPEKRSLTGIMLGIYSKGVLIFEVLNGNRTPVLRFPWRDTKKISFTVRFCIFTFGGNRTAVLEFPEKKVKEVQLQAVLHGILYLKCQGHVLLCVSLWQKKKICLQNTSDGIKHLFQTDSQKTCQYLLQLCSAQYKFHLHMKARQNNQELQDLGEKERANKNGNKVNIHLIFYEAVKETENSINIAPIVSNCVREIDIP